MSSPIDKLLSDFVDAWNAGERPRVDDYLQRASPGDRDQLAELLEDWLTLSPSPRFGEEALLSIQAEPAFAGALAEIDAEPALWPELLPRLRQRAGLQLRELATRVTAAFGLKGEEPRAERYLQRMEAGDLDASRVSRRLLDALGTALGVSGADLARAGGLRAATSGQALFRAESDAAASFEDDLEALSRAALAAAPEPMDELDRLFVGGRDA
jgi:transcriptional regulator with XRE-family HTH domain